jgi:hypothetical protein
MNFRAHPRDLYRREGGKPRPVRHEPVHPARSRINFRAPRSRTLRPAPNQRSHPSQPQLPQFNRSYTVNRGNPRFCTLFLQCLPVPPIQTLCQNGVRICVPIWAPGAKQRGGRSSFRVRDVDAFKTESSAFFAFVVFDNCGAHSQAVNEISVLRLENQRQTSRDPKLPDSVSHERNRPPVFVVKQILVLRRSLQDHF